MASLIPLSVADPQRYLAHDSIAWNTPSAVIGGGSPDLSGRPATWRVSCLKTSMSAGVVPTSSAVMNAPPRDSTNFPCARKISSRLPVRLLQMITALPPPNGSPANAFLYDMPRDNRNASRLATLSQP